MRRSTSLAFASLGLVIVAFVTPTAAAAQLNVQGTPNYGARNIAPGFMPDPMAIPIVSGGTVNVTALGYGAECQGFATAQPDFNFTLTGVSAFLRVFVDAGAEDTTLVINKPDGSWVCNDDANGGRNPVVDFTNASRGVYNVWVGSYQAGTRASATLNITELPNQLPRGGAAVAPTPGLSPTPAAFAVSSPSNSAAGELGGRVLSAEPLLVRIPPGASEVMLGSWWDREFRPLGQTVLLSSAIIVDPTFTEASPRFAAAYTRSMSSAAMQAEAGLWVLGSASASASVRNEHATFRARQTSRVARVDPILLRQAPRPPTEARYMLSAIHTGRMIDYRFTGSAAALGAGLRGIFPGGSASAAVQTTEAGVSVVVEMLGLRPRDQISVASMQDASSFLPTEEMTPVAMLAEFTPVNTGLPLRVRIQRITYDGQWDPVGGPEILVRVLHGVTVVFPRLRGPQDETVWTVPTERGTFPTPVLVTRTTPLQFIFSDEDAVNDDPAGSLEIRLLSPSPDAQCFGGVNSTAPRVHVCLIVDE